MRRAQEPKRLGARLAHLRALILALVLAVVELGCLEPRLEGWRVDGERLDLLAAAAGRPFVLVFVATDCPISNRYAPVVQRLASELAPHGVEFFLVYTDDDRGAATVEEHRRDFGYELPALFDPERALVKHTGVSVTPEVAVLDGDGRVLYRGRIDDRYVDFGRYRQQPSRDDLRLALEAVLEGTPVAEPRTRAIGCYIASPPADA